MDARDYLKRVGTEPEPPSPGALSRLHERHLMTVAFENLDIARGVPIELDESRILDKVVHGGRGGFCYELNSAFAWLLRELGYGVTLLSAEVARDDGSFGIPFDHMLLEVGVGDEEFVVDVGFGESFRQPLAFRPDRLHEEADFRFRLRQLDEYWLLERAPSGGHRFAPQYRFTRAPRRLAEYADACRYHQTSPESTFTQKTLVTRATPEGRVTLLPDRLIVRSTGKKSQREVTSKTEWADLLREHFDIVLGQKDTLCEPS